MARATAVIQAAVAALSGDIPPDNTIANGYTETYLDEAINDSLADGELAGKTLASTFGNLVGTIADSNSALGTITRDQGQYSCDVVGSVPTDPGDSSWVTIEATLPDARAIVDEFMGFMNLNTEPTGDVMPFIGWCTGSDFSATNNAIIYGVDNSDGTQKTNIRSKKAGTWDSWDRNSNGTASAIGIRGTINFKSHLSGDPATEANCRVLAASGAPNSANNTARTLSQSLFPLADLTGGTTLHLVIGFTVRATVSPAVTTTSTPLVQLIGAPADEGVSGALAAWIALGGQSNANGTATGVPVDSLVGTYNQAGTYVADWSPTDDASSAAGMLTSDADTIPRAVYERAIGGTTIQEHVDTIGPDMIADLGTLNVTPFAHVFWQGEKNANDATRAAAYAAGLSDYLDLWHTAFPDCTILLVEVQATAGGYTEVATVNSAMQAEATARSYVEIIVARGEVELQDDNLHATLAGQIYVGEAVAAWAVTEGDWDEV